MDIGDIGDMILGEKIDLVTTKLKDHKTPGIDDVPAEIAKAAEDHIRHTLYQLEYKIYETEDPPKKTSARNVKQ